MTKESTKLLVIGEGRNGRRRYDKASKRELVKACLLPGVSIAAMALSHGVNANLLRKWIHQYQQQHAGNYPGTAKIEKEEPAFIPVVEMKHAPRLNSLRVFAELPNGVKLDFSGTASNELPVLLQTLSNLPCSD
jgi:transposase